MTANAALTMATEPPLTGDDNALLETVSFKPAFAQTVNTQPELPPVIAYEANNILLAASGDNYPYNNQFDPADASAGYGLDYNANLGDQFNAFDATAPLNFDDFVDGPYDFDVNQFINSF